MAYVITTSANQITITHDADHSTFNKSEISKIRLNGLEIEIYHGSFVDTIHLTELVTIDGVTYGTNLATWTALNDTLKSGITEVFTATAGQDTFTPAFTCDGNTRVYVNGYRIVTGFSVVGGAIVFDVALTGGEEVLIEKI